MKRLIINFVSFFLIGMVACNDFQEEDMNLLSFSEENVDNIEDVSLRAAKGPLYQYYSATFNSHFYTSKVGEVPNNTYVYQKIAGNIFLSQEINTVPLYRLYHPALVDFLYATSKNAGAALGYQYIGIEGYVYVASTPPANKPFYQYTFNYGGSVNHYYTTTVENIPLYTYEGIVCYLPL